jgi:hypothetical protein
MPLPEVRRELPRTLYMGSSEKTSSRHLGE